MTEYKLELGRAGGPAGSLVLEWRFFVDMSDMGRFDLEFLEMGAIGYVGRPRWGED